MRPFSSTTAFLAADSSGDAADSPRDEAPERHSSPRLPSLTGLRILVVDDTPDACELVAALLQRAGAIVQMAGSAAEARTCLVASVPNLIISDIGMPGEDGYTFLRKLRASGDGQGPLANLCAVALTAYTRKEDRDEALAAGFQAHLTKPVDPRELFNTVVALARPPGTAVR